MSFIPGASNSAAQFPDGFTGLGVIPGFVGDTNKTMLSTHLYFQLCD